MKEKYCSGCKEKLEDGEVVATSSEGVYHHIIRDLDIAPLDCSMKKAMKGVEFFQKKVYYQGKLYGISKINKLYNSDELDIEFNKNETGDIVKGDLKGLAKELFGIF